MLEIYQSIKESLPFEDLVEELLYYVTPPLNENEIRALVFTIKSGGYIDQKTLRRYMKTSHQTVNNTVNALKEREFFRRNSEFSPARLYLVNWGEIEQNFNKEIKNQLMAKDFFIRLQELLKQGKKLSQIYQPRTKDDFYHMFRKATESLLLTADKEDRAVLAEIISYLYIEKEDQGRTVFLSELIPRLKSKFETERKDIHDVKYIKNLIERYFEIFDLKHQIISTREKRTQTKTKTARDKGESYGRRGVFCYLRIPFPIFLEELLKQAETRIPYNQSRFNQLRTFMLEKNRDFIPRESLASEALVKLRVGSCVNLYKTIYIIDNSASPYSLKEDGLLKLVGESLVDPYTASKRRSAFTPQHQVYVITTPSLCQTIKVPDKMKGQVEILSQPASKKDNYKRKDYIVFADDTVYGAIILPPETIAGRKVTAAYDTDLLLTLPLYKYVKEVTTNKK